MAAPSPNRTGAIRVAVLVVAAVGLALLLGAVVHGRGGAPRGVVEDGRGPAPAGAPHVLLVTVDTLRADRLSSYGYHRPTTPELDRLLGDGVRFAEARTGEPLTTPVLASMLTGLSPHRHGASRNGLAVAEGLPSLAKRLADEGWRTAAFVSNWVLSDEASGLAEHFDVYDEVLTRRRYLGLFEGEATARDVNFAALRWLRAQRGAEPQRPVLLWVHYVEPHAPYEPHPQDLERIGAGSEDDRDLYDGEVAHVDRRIGRLLRVARRLLGDRDTVTVFASDHGESLGEHDYWTHGAHLYEPSMRIPLGISWPGRIEPGVAREPVLLTDVAPTVTGLLGLDLADGLDGVDRSTLLLGEAAAAPAPEEPPCLQAHRGVVLVPIGAERARSRGLLAVGRVEGHLKEVYYLDEERTLLFDLAADPGELRSLVPASSAPSPALRECLEEVAEGLGATDRLPVSELDSDARERLKSLGYLD